jgi:alanine racemase
MSSLVWVELDAGAPDHNLREMRRCHGFSGIHCAVVKSNAYGHGVREICGLLGEAAWLAVNSLDEGLELRGLGETRPVLLLGHVDLGRLVEAREAGLRMVVYNRETLAAVASLPPSQKRLRLHLHLETGTWRQGVLPEHAPGFAREILNTPGAELEGISTHFANIEDTLEHAYAKMQLETFERVCAELAVAGINPPVKHTACTAAAILFRETHFNMLRTGIGTYGLWPSRETRLSAETAGVPIPDLKPVMTWKTRVVQVKDVPRGCYIGYGCTYRTTRPTVMAVLPVGYADGYRRAAGNVGWVLVGGMRAPVLGRVCMNLIMADVTDIPGVRLEDEAVLLGSSGDETVSAELMASWCGTINYEIVTGISPLLPRMIRTDSP